MRIGLFGVSVANTKDAGGSVPDRRGSSHEAVNRTRTSRCR